MNDVDKKMAELEERVKKEREKKEKVENDALDGRKNEKAATKDMMFQFFLGLLLFVSGFFWVTHNTVIYSGFTLANFIGFTPPFGAVLLPFLIGVGILFYNEKSLLGWGLSILGLVIIILGIIMGLRIIFRPVSLYEGLLMFGMIFGGAGLMLRALRKLE